MVQDTVTPSPEKHANDGTLTDVFSYVKQRSPQFRHSNDYAHLVGLKATVEAYWSHLPRLLVFAQTGSPWESKCCQNILQAQPWLEGFRASNGDLDAALGALAGSWTKCTFDLIQLNHVLSNTIVLAAWKFCALDRLEEFDRRRKIVRLDEVKVTYLLRMMGGDKFDRFDDMTRVLWNDLQDCARLLPENEYYIAFALRVADFCLRAGCPAPKRDALGNTYALRAHLSRGSGIETELRKEIEELRRTTRKQQRIITNLSFRHLLEMLPPPSTGPATSTVRWKSFFVGALLKAQTVQAQQGTGHPLVPLLKKYPKLKQLEEAGTNLYGTLSTNIHHYTGEFRIEEDQWDALQVDLLTALVPQAQNQSDTGVDWNQERRRF